MYAQKLSESPQADYEYMNRDLVWSTVTVRISGMGWDGKGRGGRGGTGRKRDGSSSW